MSLDSVIGKFEAAKKSMGKAGLNALFPNDFEYYLFALELVNSIGVPVDYFAFPILPESIQEEHNELTNVKKTMGGTVVLKTSTFTPRDLILSGNFGRTFKVLINDTRLSVAGFSLSMRNGVFTIPSPKELVKKALEFSSFAKTGYGCVKAIEAIKEKSKQLDTYNKPHVLYCYNPILGNNYQVEVMSFSHSQDDKQSNQIPRYNLRLKAVAPLDSLLGFDAFSLEKNLSLNLIQQGANSLAGSIRKSIGF